jgi:predicted DNA-binding protein (MmcQ/YjbR family)
VAALMLPFAEPTHYGLGKSGWVTAQFGVRDEIPLALLREWIDESYRAVAPKKLIAQIAADGRP